MKVVMMAINCNAKLFLVTIFEYMCHKVPCYKKFVRITENIEGLKSPNLPKPDIKSPTSFTRSKKKLFEPQVLSTPKKKLHKQPITPQPSYKQA